ncbi:MAG: hypothetical protein LBD63_01360, partial [Mycoplasmataceae bacterium]|nr:hypothetical protein [Mycoplasmataceae bacterium]
MKKINIRCENGQLKKWVKWTIVGFCCATIFGVTIGGICISGLHPWSEIVSSSLYTSGLKDNTLTIMTNQTPQTNLASENIKIQIKNHNGAKNITLLDQYYFA